MTSDPAAFAGLIRSAREALVRDLRDGRAELGTLDPDGDAGMVKVVVLAESVPGVGKVRARHVLDTLGIDHGARWGELGSHRQRVVEALSALRDDGASPASGR